MGGPRGPLGPRWYQRLLNQQARGGPPAADETTEATRLLYGMTIPNYLNRGPPCCCCCCCCCFPFCCCCCWRTRRMGAKQHPDGRDR